MRRIILKNTYTDWPKHKLFTLISECILQDTIMECVEINNRIALAVSLHISTLVLYCKLFINLVCNAIKFLNITVVIIFHLFLITSFPWKFRVKFIFFLCWSSWLCCRFLFILRHFWIIIQLCQILCEITWQR